MTLKLRTYILYFFFAVTSLVSIGPTIGLGIYGFYGATPNILPFESYNTDTSFLIWYLEQGIWLSSLLIVLTILLGLYIHYFSTEMSRFSFDKPQAYLLSMWAIHTCIAFILGAWAIESLSIIVITLSCIGMFPLYCLMYIVSD